MKQTEENNITVLPASAAAEARPQGARDTNTTAAATTESAANASETPSAATDAEAAPRRHRSRRKPAAASADAEAPEAAAPAASEAHAAAKATATEGAADKPAPARPKADAASDGPQSRSTDAATDESATAERPDAPATPESAPAAEGTTRRKRSRSRRRKSAAEGTPEAGEQAAPAEATEAAASGTRKGAAAAANADGTSGSRKESAAEADDKTAERKEAAPNRRRQERAPKGDRQGAQQKQGREGNARSDRSKQQQEPSRQNAAADKSASNDRKSGERKPQRERRRSQSPTQQANGAADTGRRAELHPVKIKPGKKLRRGTVAAQRTWALVTGAGTGIGRCYALRLAASGYQLVLVGNRRNSLEAVRREILDAAAAEGRREDCEVRICQLDLAHAEAAEKLLAWTRAQKISVDLLINNAGIFSFRDILRTPIERIERIILLHNLTLTKLCRLYASDMVYREAQGHILNMSSFSLWMPFPGLSLYSASKAYVRSFSVSFAREVRESGIRVTAVCPAGVATDLYGLTPRWQRIGLRIGALISADACARRGLRALRRGRRCIVPDWWNRIWIPLCKSLPMTLLRPLRKLTMKYQK